MDTVPISATPPIGPTRSEQMMAKAEDLEASFLAEMLAHTGLGELSGPFGGGSGEGQFSSFLRAEQARLMVEQGGLGLAESIFNSMVEAEHVTKA